MREPEPDVVRRAQAGDLDAFERIVRDCQPGAWFLAYHLTQDASAADDVVQEAFVRAFLAVRTYRSRWKFTSWLLQIVRNCAMDHHRRLRRAGTALRRVGLAPEEEQPPPVEERSRIHDAVRRLPIELREPFVVIEVLGHSYDEASVILSVKVGTLKSRMHRARAALIEALREEAAGEV
jgi:RNA polymerase sigma-70 factor (ECF subfamily)